ncbi:MAG: imidazole glycerol phosphate synthase subunit HisH [Syntrophomonadaceae bacterium]|nr:imidazole glycerol phosphate synthase subunit HisH [Syntrophomonadaceae bacterium]
MIAIIDYGMGNVRSVFNAMEYLDYDSIISSDYSDIEHCSHIILPGVGAFAEAMKNIRKRSLDKILEQEVLYKGKPFLGICLGMQLLASSSEEFGVHDGLGWFKGQVLKLKAEEDGLKMPHIGWNDIKICKEHPIFKGLNQDTATFYFVHSFHLNCKDENEQLAYCEYGEKFTAAIFRDNIVATQFHPEKSQDNGLLLLNNFVCWRRADA